MTIFLTIIITLAAWQLLCTLFAFIVDDGEKYCCFSTFIVLGIGKITVYPVSKLVYKIRLKRYNKTHKLYYLYEYDEKRNKYLMVTSAVIENDFAKQFNIKENKNNPTDKYIVVPANTLIKNLCIISECKIDKTFSNQFFYRFPKTYIENYMI